MSQSNDTNTMNLGKDVDEMSDAAHKIEGKSAAKNASSGGNKKVKPNNNEA